jgi:hypothetical protein
MPELPPGRFSSTQNIQKITPKIDKMTQNHPVNNSQSLKKNIQEVMICFLFSPPC